MRSEYRGVQLIGDKSANRISAIEVLDREGNRVCVSPADYCNKAAEPHDYHTLPWEEDVTFKAAKPKARSK